MLTHTKFQNVDTIIWRYVQWHTPDLDDDDDDDDNDDDDDKLFLSYGWPMKSI